MNTTSLKRTPPVTLVCAGSLLILMTGCRVGANYVRPQVTAPAVYRGPDEAPVSSAGQNSLGDQQWTQVFREPELQDLIRVAFGNNYDMRIAAQRVSIASQAKGTDTERTVFHHGQESHTPIEAAYIGADHPVHHHFLLATRRRTIHWRTFETLERHVTFPGEREEW
jgi:hypothetical protein